MLRQTLSDKKSGLSLSPKCVTLAVKYLNYVFRASTNILDG